MIPVWDMMILRTLWINQEEMSERHLGMWSVPQQCGGGKYRLGRHQNVVEKEATEEAEITAALIKGLLGGGLRHPKT